MAISTPALRGTLAVDAGSGVITYTHTGSSADGWDSFAYTVDDMGGAVSSPATVWIALVPPPQVSITAPAPGATVIGTSPSLSYSLAGYLPFVGGARFRIDDGAWATETVLVGSHGWSGVAPGAHTLQVELLSPSLVPVASPGASAQVSISTDFDADGDGTRTRRRTTARYARTTRATRAASARAGPDGIGDACQCGDLDADGDADASDRLAAATGARRSARAGALAERGRALLGERRLRLRRTRRRPPRPARSRASRPGSPRAASSRNPDTI